MALRSLVLTVIGPDRPGLVEALARTIAAHDGNWIESQMSRLAGRFAGLLRVEVDADKVDALRAALESDRSAGLSVQVLDGHEEDAATGASLEVVGGDRPGIIRQIASVLAAHDVNVVRLETTRTGAPWSGEAIFRARATIALPVGGSTEPLRAALEAIALDLVVEVALDD